MIAVEGAALSDKVALAEGCQHIPTLFVVFRSVLLPVVRALYDLLCMCFTLCSDSTSVHLLLGSRELSASEIRAHVHYISHNNTHTHTLKIVPKLSARCSAEYRETQLHRTKMPTSSSSLFFLASSKCQTHIENLSHSAKTRHFQCDVHAQHQLCCLPILARALSCF